MQSQKRKSELSTSEFKIVNVDKHFAYRFFYLNSKLVGYDSRGRGQCWNYPHCISDYKSSEINSVYVYNCD